MIDVWLIVFIILGGLFFGCAFALGVLFIEIVMGFRQVDCEMQDDNYYTKDKGEIL